MRALFCSRVAFWGCAHMWTLWLWRTFTIRCVLGAPENALSERRLDCIVEKSEWRDPRDEALRKIDVVVFAEVSLAKRLPWQGNLFGEEGVGGEPPGRAPSIETFVPSASLGRPRRRLRARLPTTGAVTPVDHPSVSSSGSSVCPPPLSVVHARQEPSARFTYCTETSLSFSGAAKSKSPNRPSRINMAASVS